MKTNTLALWLAFSLKKRHFATNLIIFNKKYITIILSTYVNIGIGYGQAQTQWLVQHFEHTPRKVTSYCVLRDDEGVLWWGTDEGLKRYDGLNILTYHKDFQVFTLFNDPQTKRLWVGTSREGLFYLDLTAGIDHLKLTPVSLKGINTIRFIKRYSSNHLLLGTDEGLFSFDINQKSITKINYQNNSTDPPIVRGWTQIEKKEWFSADNFGLGFRDQTDGSFNVLYKLPQNRILALNKTIQDQLVYGTELGNWGLLLPSNPPQEISKGKFKAPIRSIRSSSHGTWFATQGDGLWLINDFKQAPQRIPSLPSEVWDVFEDRYQTVWVASTEGLYQIKLKPNFFSRIERNDKENSTFQTNALISTSSTVLLSSSFGLYTLENNALKLIAPTDPNNLPYLHRLVETQEGQVWGLEMDKLVEWNPKQKNFDIESTHSRLGSSIVALNAAANGGLVLITPYEVGWIKKSNQGEQWQKLPQEAITKGINAVYLASKNVWFATNGAGLLRSGWLQEGKPPHSFNQCGQRVLDLQPDAKGNLWFITEQSLGFINTNFQIQCFGLEEGLPMGSRLQAILPDQDKVWLSTEHEFGYFHITDRQFYYWGLSSGVQNYFLKQQITKLKDGRILFGGKEGLYTFNPNHNPKPPKPDLKVLGFEIPGYKTFSHLEAPLSLPYPFNALVLHVASSDFWQTITRRFQYRILGVEDTWQESPQNILKLLRLPKGQHTLQLRTANENGVWSAPLSLKVETKDAWWLTDQAFILYVLLIFTAIYLIWKQRTNKALERLKQKHLKATSEQERRYFLETERAKAAKKRDEEIARYRSLVSDRIHDDMRGDFAAIKVSCSYLQRTLALNPKQASKVASILYLAQKNFEIAKEIEIIIRPDFDLISKFLAQLEHETQTYVSCEYGFEYNDLDQPDYIIDSFIRNHIYKVYKLCLANITLHAQASFVKIRFSLAQNILQITIQDNGIGFDTTANHLGSGLKNMQNAAEDIGATIDIKSEQNQGTIVSLSLNLEEAAQRSQEALKAEAILPTFNLKLR